MGSSVFSRLARRAGQAGFFALVTVVAGSTFGRAVASDTGTPVAAAKTAKDHTPVHAPAAVDVVRTRFIVGLEQQVAFQAFTLSNPYRVIVDLPETKYQLPEPRPAAVGLVKSFVGGLVAPGKVRIVIEVAGPVLIEKAAIETPKDSKQPRLILEMVPTDARTFDVGMSRRSVLADASMLGGFLFGKGDKDGTVAAAAGKPAVKPVIVLDPGHGGHDGGATRNGAVEKNIVLAFGLLLRDKLKATGHYDIRMTRENDSFVELNERRDFAERNKATLFMAIHADSANRDARGATIYSLREGVANTLARSVKRGNGGVELDRHVIEAAQQANSNIDDLKSFLGDLSQRDLEATKTRTEVFSKTVAETMSEATTLKQDPLREAAFRVLKTAKVPSVLIELGYVTNRQDAQLLQSQQWQDKVSDSILAAVESYFANPDVRFPN